MFQDSAKTDEDEDVEEEGRLQTRFHKPRTNWYGRGLHVWYDQPHRRAPETQSMRRHVYQQLLELPRAKG